MKNYYKILLVLLISILCTNCSFHTKDIYIPYQIPAKYNLGLKPKISVIETKGSRIQYGEDFTDYFVRKGKRNGFNFANKTSLNIKYQNRGNKPFYLGLEGNNIDNNEYLMTMELVDKDEQIFFREFKDKTIIKLSDDEIVQQKRRIEREAREFAENERKDSLRKDRSKKVYIAPEIKYEREIEVIRRVEYVRTEVVIQVSLASRNRIVYNQREMKEEIVWEKINAPSDKSDRYSQVLYKLADDIIEDVSPKFTYEQFIMKSDDEGEQEIIDKYKDHKNSNLAINNFKEYLKVNPLLASCNYNIGLLYDSMGDYEEAMFYYNNAIKFDSSNFEFRNAKSGCMTRLQYWNELNRDKD